MTTSDQKPSISQRIGTWRRRLVSPRWALAALLLTATALSKLPPRWTDPARDRWEELLRPAQAVTVRSAELCREKVAWLRGAIADGSRVADAEHQAAQLADDNRRLEAQVRALELQQSEAASKPSGSATEPLLLSDAVAARVLGQQAQAIVRSHDLVDAGSRAGAQPGAIVIDAGRDLALEPGRLVSAGGCVWGKLLEVGPYTSVMRRVNEPGYREMVQIARGDGGQMRPGPRGMIVGTGEPLCRIELVATTEPVAVGDEVYTADDGALRVPLHYGRVVRVERAAGESHWQIWMEPAVGDETPREVAVLRMDLNPSRVAGRAVQASYQR